MNADEFLEDSDSSDEDYVPDTKVEEAPSEEESDGDQEDALSGSDSESKSKGKKRLKTDKRKKKKAKGSTPSEGKCMHVNICLFSCMPLVGYYDTFFVSLVKMICVLQTQKT